MNDRRSFLRGASVLIGHAAFPQVLAGFLAGCSSDTAPARTPTFLDGAQMRTLTTLVDVILPATDSPSASSAQTQWFVDLAIGACANPLQQQTFRKGLNDLSAAGFDTADDARRTALLTERAATDMELPYDQSFFKILKDYTLTGYFHSQIGATQALAYEKVPGGYQGDLPLAQDQKAWAI